MITVNDTLIKVGHFPDGTQCIEFPSIQLYYSEDSAANQIAWYYDSDEELFTLASTVDWIRRRIGRFHSLNLKLPYLPNSRMDRIKDVNENFSFKVFANLINSFNFDRVEVFNAHSNVNEALINNIRNIPPEYDVKKVIEIYQPDVIFFPDEGACKRYADLKVVKESNLPVTFGIKKRDWKSGKILGLDVISDTDLTGKKVLIVDDIISKGFTFFYSGNKLKELGAVSIGLYASHCEDTILDGELLKDKSPIDIIYTTDSILHIAHNKIKIINKFKI